MIRKPRKHFSFGQRVRGGLAAVGVVGVMAGAAAVPAGAAQHESNAEARAPDLSWAPCPDQGGFECATATVPRNYRSRDGAELELAVIRSRAEDPARRLGTLFVNPGGPGAAKAMLPVLVPFLPEAMRERFDIVTWDPRGFGESTSVQCFGSREEEDRFLAGVGLAGDTFPVGSAEQQRWIKRYAAFGRHCQRREGTLLRHMSTAETARDMNQLRRALGAGQLNYYGNSYGTFLGATYANLFPDRVRTMVLGSNTNPSAWVGRKQGAYAGSREGSFLPSFLRQRSDMGSRKTLNAFLDLCGSASGAECEFTAGSPAGTRAKFAMLLERLRSRPAGAEPTYADTVSIVAATLYGIGQWGQLGQMLQDLWEDGSTSRDPRSRETLPPPPFVDSEPAAAGATSEGYGSFGQFLGVVCGESPNPEPESFPEIDCFAFDRSGPVAGGWTWLGEPCATWPARAAARYTGPWDRRTPNPIVVIGITHDPATPYQGAVAMSEQLGRARLLTVDGYGHGTFGQSCTYPFITRYLIDKTPPPRGSRCRGLQPFGAE